MITLPPPFPYETAGLVVPKVEMVELVPVDLVELLLLELLLLLPVLPLLLLPLLPVEPFPPPLRRWSAGDTTGTNMSRMGSENLGWTMSFIGLVCVVHRNSRKKYNGLERQEERRSWPQAAKA